MKKIFRLTSIIIFPLLMMSFCMLPYTKQHKTNSSNTKIGTIAEDYNRYKVKITFDITKETRTSRYGGTIISQQSLSTKSTIEYACATSETEARIQAKENCSSFCTREGNYLGTTSINGETAYMFEVRKISSVEIVEKQGQCY